MNEQLSDQLVQKEVEKYNRKVNSLTNQFLQKMRGFLNQKHSRVDQIDQTVDRLKEQRTSEVNDIDNLTLIIQRNEEKVSKQ